MSTTVCATTTTDGAAVAQVNDSWNSDDILQIDPEVYEHQLGPDHVIPTDEIRTWSRNGAVKLDLRNSPPDAPLPHSVPTALRRTVEKYGERIAFRVERDGQWKSWTFRQYYEEVRIVAKAFIKLGLRRFCGVGILGFNSPEWVISEIAAIFAGGIGAGIYPTSSPASCCALMQNSAANVILVDGATQLKKILEVRDKLPHLRALVQWLGKPTQPGVLTWDQLLAIGRSIPDEVLERRLRGISINQPCLIIYTSGTTGEAKGVMMTHDAALFTSWVMFVYYCEWKPGEKLVSYLPLNHTAGKFLDIFSGIVAAIEVSFARPDALKGSLVDTLKVVRPTQFFTVPRLMEKMYTRLNDAEKKMGFVRKRIFNWAKGVGWRYCLNRMNGNLDEPPMFRLAKNLVFDKIRIQMGLENVKELFTGSAPIDFQVLKYLHSVHLPVNEVYGLTESGGVLTYNIRSVLRVGSVGINCVYDEVKIDNPDADGNGEVIARTRHSFAGYLDKEQETKETIDEEGWVHTGDIGRLDEDGFLYITGRFKELLITSGGENIAPVPIEENIKKELDVISNCMVVGDKRNYLTVLLTLKTEQDKDLMPTDILTTHVATWCASLGCNAKTTTDVLQNITESMKKTIQEAIDRANTRAVSNAARVQKFSILPHDFSIANEELGPTLKLRRPFVTDRYKNLIDSLYKSS